MVHRKRHGDSSASNDVPDNMVDRRSYIFVIADADMTSGFLVKSMGESLDDVDPARHESGPEIPTEDCVFVVEDGGRNPARNWSNGDAPVVECDWPGGVDGIPGPLLEAPPPRPISDAAATAAAAAEAHAASGP